MLFIGFRALYSPTLGGRFFPICQIGKKRPPRIGECAHNGQCNTMLLHSVVTPGNKKKNHKGTPKESF